jgi:hypothetical protein
MMADVELVQCRRGHMGLTVCPSCKGTGMVPEGTKGGHSYLKENGDPPDQLPQGDPVCQSCIGSGLLGPHSCIG